MPIQQSSLNDVFRFIKIRKPDSQRRTIKLLDTQFATLLKNAPSAPNI